MYSKLILITCLFFTTNVFASNWFVGVSGGGNVTRKTPVGDLPMAREEFFINAYRKSDSQEFEDIAINIINRGGTRAEYLAAAKHLMVLQLHYSAGWHIGINGGYKMNNFIISLKLNYKQMSYDSIKDDDAGQNILGWDDDGVAGESRFIYGIISGEYILPIINSIKIEPVLGMGLGVARTTDMLKDADKKAERSQNIFAYEIKLGINYNFNKNLQGNIGSSFFGTSKIKATNNYLKQWQFINIGVRYFFN